MGKWFALKNDILYNQSIKARTKIVLAILSHHKNNSSIIKTTHAKLDKWTNIQHSDRYLKELISLGYIQKIKDGEYKMIYRVRFQDKKKSQFTKQEYDEFVEKYTKIEYDHIFSYKPEDVIDYYIITNILKMNKFNIDDINKIDITIFLSSKNDKSPWDSIEEVNEVLSKLSQKSFLKYEVTLQCLLPIPNEEEWEQKETAPEEQKADILNKEVSDNIIQKADPEITKHEEKYTKLIKKYIEVTKTAVNYDKALIHIKQAEEAGKTYNDIKAIVKYLADNGKPIYFVDTTSINEVNKNKSPIAENPSYFERNEEHLKMIREGFKYGRTKENLYAAYRNDPEKIKLIDMVAKELNMG